MPVAFLNPWFWLGALALAVPIWLHLRRRKEKKTVQFSAVRFLEDEPVAARQPVRLRDLLLFCCRAAALLAIVAAFAWPYWRRANRALVRESRVYILDNTLSHQARGGFQRDRERLLRELANSPQDVQIAVVELTALPRALASFGDTRESAIAQVQASQPSFTRGSYLAAFRQASDLLANSLGLSKRIILLADNQENQWTENVNSLPFLRGVQVELAPRAEALLPNLSLSEARAQRVFLGDKSLINFSMKLNRVGEARKAVVRVRADDRLVLERELELAGSSVLLQGQWEADPGHWLRGVAEVEGGPDSLPEDNRIFFDAPPVVEGQVALLAHSSYLRLALSPEIMRGHWSARRVEAGNLAEEADSASEADVLCLESGYLQTADARRLVMRYLAAGRGVILLLDRVTPVVDGFLRELDFDVQGKIQRNEPERFQFVASSHRLFHPFAAPDYGNLLEVNVRSYFKIQAQRATPLIFSEQGNGLMFEAARQQGKLFVVAFGLDREHTSWPIHSTFIPFLDLLLQAARAEESTLPELEPGGNWAVQTGLPQGEVVVVGEGRELSRTAIEQGRAMVPLPARPGSYEVRFPGSQRAEQVISVNASPKESELVYADAPEALSAWRVDAGKANGERTPRLEANLVEVLQQRYWWWMLVAGLLALLGEMVLLARARRA